MVKKLIASACITALLVAVLSLYVGSATAAGPGPCGIGAVKKLAPAEVYGMICPGQ